jgi:hypothetical protein
MNSARNFLGLLESRGDIAKCNIFLKARSRKATPARMNATTSIRTFSRTDKRVLLPLMLFPLAVMTMYEHRTFCQGHENDNESRSDDDNQEQSYDEEEEKDSCPFCRFFLESPCSEAFQVWHECIKVRHCIDMTFYSAFILPQSPHYFPSFVRNQTRQLIAWYHFNL